LTSAESVKVAMPGISETRFSWREMVSANPGTAKLVSNTAPANHIVMCHWACSEQDELLFEATLPVNYHRKAGRFIFTDGQRHEQTLSIRRKGAVRAAGRLPVTHRRSRLELRSG
jgi:hypothetical protein